METGKPLLPCCRFNPEAKGALLRLMRDPGIRQARGVAHDGSNGFCVAGLVFEAYRREKGEGRWYYHPTAYRWLFGTEETRGDEAARARLKARIFSWMGIDRERRPSVVYEGERRCIVWLNDNVLSLRRLADLIEAQL